MEEKEFDKKKAHQSRHSGRKAEKKASKNKHVQEQDAKERNPKAFAFQSVVKAQRRFVRSQDIKSKKHHIPVIDRSPVEPPPVVVAVVGGPKVGKSTLLQCLIKNYTRQRLSSIMGPVTIVAGKKRRLTFIEVNNDVNSMIDIAKVADIVLMLIDATFGIEMETFEFLEICRAHGTPRIMGVLNHLDMFKDNKALKKKKRVLKNRFQVELYPGAKLFYLSGLIHGEYLKNEIKNLGRFISVMKFRPLTWRSSHPYVLVDRMEDITNPESVRTNPKCDRDVVLYGFVRGVAFHQNQRVHIAGCGDFQIKDINFLADPCPLPEHQKKRSLNEKERLTYAPMSGVGGIVYDKDAVYIDLGGSHHGKRVKHEAGSDSEDDNKGDSILQPLLDLQKTADEKRAQSQIQLFSNTKLLKNESDEDEDHDDDDDDENDDDDDNEDMEAEDSKQSELNSVVNKSLPEQEIVTDSTGRVRRRAIFHDNLEKDEDGGEDDEDDDDEDDDDDDSEDDDSENEEFEDEEEESSDEEDSEEDNSLNNLQPPVKKKKIVASAKQVSSLDDNSDSEDYDLEGDLSILKGEESGKTNSEVKKSKLKVSNSTEKEKVVGLKNKDVEVTMKIQGLLDKLKSKPISKNIAKSRTISGDSGISESEEDSDNDESETDGDEDMQVTTNDNSFENRDNKMKGDETLEGSSSEDEDEDEDANLGYRSEMFKQATDNFYKNQSTVSYLRKYIYGEVAEEEKGSSDDDTEEVGGLFRRNNKTKQEGSLVSSHGLVEAVDTSRYNPTHQRNWADEDLLDSIRDCFVTGEWKESENAAALLKMDDEDEDLYGDFEDLETGKKVAAEEVQKTEEEEKNEDVLNESEAPEVKKEERTAKEKRFEKKKRLKEMFDSAYDDKGDNEYFDSLKTEMSQQAQLNREEFDQLDDEQRVQYEGYRPGMYIRMEFSRVPCEFSTNFDASYPIVVGGLLDNEQKMGFIRVRIKVHRWYPKILKNKDPLILSLGWRRFQTLMYYAKREDDFRMRSLKYARKYLHVEGMFWGPITPISSGFVALQNITDRVPDFRIAANGVILETDQSTKICKKLKLIGHPEKILKKTAFVKGMFGSETEIAKFEGAKVQTQSGIRGLVKKAKGRDGIFRATFEDVIKLSDVIILKTWAPVELTKYCTSVRSMLLPAEDKAKWKGMRTVGEIKKERNIRNTPNPDSLYTKITARRTYVPLPLRVPKELQRALPYNEKPKITPKGIKPERVIVVKDPHEIKIDNFMKRLKTMMEDKQERDETHKQVQKKKFQLDIEDRENMKQMREKRKKAAACRFKSKKEGKKNKVV